MRRAVRYLCIHSRLQLAFLLLVLSPSICWSVDIQVISSADAGAGTLREALTNAATGDRIVFNLATPSVITLASDLPVIANDISFFNRGSSVSIDRNSFNGLALNGDFVDPTRLSIVDGGAPSTSADVIAGPDTVVFGSGTFTGNLTVPHVISPGESPGPNSVYTLNVDGDLDLSGAEGRFDVSATTAGRFSDLLTVTGTADLTGATLTPNFVGNQFIPNQRFLLIDSDNPLVGSFTNANAIFNLPLSGFLQAVQDTSLGADDFGLIIRSNGVTFDSIVTGSNNHSAAMMLDQLRLVHSTSPGIVRLTNGSQAQAAAAIAQVSGTLYPTLLGAEVNHIQNNLESVRDRVVLQRYSQGNNRGIVPWIRAYGFRGEVDTDDRGTNGYEYDAQGVELGLGADVGVVSAFLFAHLSSGDLELDGADQNADIESYRLGAMLQFQTEVAYGVFAFGGGAQEYEAFRSLSLLEGPASAASDFSGSSGFGYLEIGARPVPFFAPYVSLHGTHVSLNDLAETGGSEFALRVPGHSGSSIRSVLGFTLIGESDVASARLRLGWLHEFQEESDTIQSFISNTAAHGFTTESARPGIDWLMVRAQLDLGAVLGGNLSIGYQGQHNARSSVNLLVGGVHWVF